MDQLYPLVLSTEKLYEKMSDTYAIAASEAYSAALLIYRTGKQLKTEDGYPPGVADLARRFRRGAEADVDEAADVDANADADAQPLADVD